MISRRKIREMAEREKTLVDFILKILSMSEHPITRSKLLEICKDLNETDTIMNKAFYSLEKAGYVMSVSAIVKKYQLSAGYGMSGRTKLFFPDKADEWLQNNRDFRLRHLTDYK